MKMANKGVAINKYCQGVNDALWMNASISCVTRYLHLVNTSLFAIFTNQHLQNLESIVRTKWLLELHQPFFRYYKEKRKKRYGHARLV